MLTSRTLRTPKTGTLHCADCGFPYAVIRDGVLIIKSMHRGKMHTNRISVAALADMCAPQTEREEEVIDGAG